MTIEKPDIEWKDNIPHSKMYQDIYYSPEKGLKESEFVFIQHNKLAERWAKKSFDNQNSTFVIAETGFGTGLNFLAACLLCNKLNTSIKKQRLHFISFEKYPLHKNDLKTAHTHFPDIYELSEQLIAHYPKRIAGLHSIAFSENIRLSLYFGDATEGLNALDSEKIKVDAWFFDGFSPKKNEALWSEDLFNATQAFNKTGSSFATFTSAGHVRRKLQAIGFSSDKVKGFEQKREMLIGTFLNVNQEPKKTYPYAEKPWLKNREHNQENIRKEFPKKVGIIGAGLAGTWLAHTLAERGIKVEIFESSTHVAAGASGNPRGATYLKLEPEQENLSSVSQKFYLSAYLYAIETLNRLFPDSPDIWRQSGIMQLVTEEKQEAQFQQLLNINPFEDIIACLEKEKASELSNTKQVFDALFFPYGGDACPSLICEYLIQHKNISLHTNTEIKSLNYAEDLKQWRLECSATHVFENFDCIVLCNSFTANSFFQTTHLPLFKVRGQSTQIAASALSAQLKNVICAKGYLTPEINGLHTIGSTFDPRSIDTTVLDSDNETNLQYLADFSPDFFKNLGGIKIEGARAGIRCQSPDMLPMLGFLGDYEDFKETYSDIGKGQLKKNYPAAKCFPSLYINTAHASRGLISTPYCAAILAAEICHDLPICEKEVLEALAPNRFYFRQLKKSS